MDADKLPWAVPAFSLFEGAGLGTGAFAVPAQGTMVFCFFEMGDVYQPVYFAEARDGANGITNTPNVKEFITTGDNLGCFTISIDKTAHTLRIVHPSSSYFTMDTDNGNITLSAWPGMVNIISNGDTDITAQGDVNVTAVGNVVIKGAKVSINP
jgi:hypothetical protein